jgi:hypothetical protein
MSKGSFNRSETTLHEAEVTTSNLSSPLLCGHVKKKKNVTIK